MNDYVNEKLKKFNEFLKTSKIAIIGIGVSNIPLLKYLKDLNANVTLFEEKDYDKIYDDVKVKIEEYNFNGFYGADALSNLVGYDIIFRSPSCMPTRKELMDAKNNGAIVTTEIEMFMKLFPGKIIGVTGSDGKTTTTSLIYEILTAAGFNTYLGGNIGKPLFSMLPVTKPEDYAVLELSSFQLMHMDVSPSISVITNITPNHLNIHKDYEEYIDAKKNIIKYQDKNGISVLFYNNDLTKEAKNDCVGNCIYFSETEITDGYYLDGDIIYKVNNGIKEEILNTDDLTLKGHHMYLDVCAALAATNQLVSLDIALPVVKKFKGVEHRLELVRELDGVKYYNDSIGSSPTRTIAGLSAFKERITLIAGGYDKNLDYTDIGKPILDKVDNLILIGPTAIKIKKAVLDESNKENKSINIIECDKFEDTVLKAREVTKPGAIVLLSPASASFDLFRNFEERGKKFKELVNNLK